MPESEYSFQGNETTIPEAIACFRQMKRCEWCKSPDHPVRSSALCESCYRRKTKHEKLAKQVAELPSKTSNEPLDYLLARREYEILVKEVELCKISGEVLEERLDCVEPIHLESQFIELGTKLLGYRKGQKLFDYSVDSFRRFSPTQRIWHWYLVSRLTEEVGRNNRRILAQHLVAEETNSKPRLDKATKRAKTQ